MTMTWSETLSLTISLWLLVDGIWCWEGNDSSKTRINCNEVSDQREELSWHKFRARDYKLINPTSYKQTFRSSKERKCIVSTRQRYPQKKLEAVDVLLSSGLRIRSYENWKNLSFFCLSLNSVLREKSKLKLCIFLDFPYICVHTKALEVSLILGRMSSRNWQRWFKHHSVCLCDRPLQQTSIRWNFKLQGEYSKSYLSSCHHNFYFAAKNSIEDECPNDK